MITEKPVVVAGRRASRLAAIQGLYQCTHCPDTTRESLLVEILRHRVDVEIEGLKLTAPDKPFLAYLIGGVMNNREALDHMISAALPRDWKLERLDRVLAVLLRLATFELAFPNDVPPKSVVCEYVDLAHGFFTEKEPGLINGVLHSIATELHPESMGNAPLGVQPPSRSGRLTGLNRFRQM